MINLEVLADADAVAERAAQRLVAALAAAAGPVAVCLSGGGTPERLYRCIATERWRSRLPWTRVHWFWGDERFVPPDHHDSNYGLARRALLDAAPVSPSHIHRIPTQPDPQTAVLAYEAELQRFYGTGVLKPGRPLFEVTLLGLGADGHTASLFAGGAALEERDRWAAAVTGPHGDPRITLTLPAINASRLVLVLVTGASKRDVLRRIVAGEPLPAARVQPDGAMQWLVDPAAAGSVAA